MQDLIVPAKEFRTNFPKYQAFASKGISIVVTKRSKPLFRLEPIDQDYEDKITESLMDYENNPESFLSHEDTFKETLTNKNAKISS